MDTTSRVVVKAKKGEEIEDLVGLEALVRAIREATTTDNPRCRFVITMTGKIKSVNVEEDGLLVR